MDKYRRIQRIADKAFETCDIGRTQIYGVPKPAMEIWFHSARQLVIIFKDRTWYINCVTLEYTIGQPGHVMPQDLNEMLDYAEAYLIARENSKE